MKLAFIKKWWLVSKNAIALCISGLSFVLVFFSWEDLGFHDNCSKLIAFFFVYLVIEVLIFFFLYFKKSDCRWERGHGSLKVMFGNIISLGFKRTFWCQKKKRVIVIPVNTHFDTIVENPSPGALVSSTTLHGQWVQNYMQQKQISAETLQSTIYSKLDQQGKSYQNQSERRGGKRKYEKGVCALLDGDDECYYVLLALSDFDDNNNAHATKDNLIFCTKELLKFIDSTCQGYECFIPLMGTGRSRTGLSHQQSLHTLLSTIDLYNDWVNTPLNIVVYKGDKSKVSIYGS